VFESGDDSLFASCPFSSLLYLMFVSYRRLAAQQAVQGSNKPNLSASGGGPDKYQGMSKEDIELAQRLERLKERPKGLLFEMLITNKAVQLENNHMI